MSNSNVVKLVQPGTFSDQLTEVLRRGARCLLAQAVEAEVADFLGGHGELKTGDGRQRVVRHGHLPEREVLTGIGPVALRQPRVRDRAAAADDPGRIRFSSMILPPYMRRSKSIETLLPILYLKGISTGDFSEALAALLGKDAPGLSASAIGRLKEGWQDDHATWARRDLSAIATFSVEVLRRLLESAQYVSIKYTERLADAGIEPSVGSVGDSYDNALAETINGLYKAEVIHRRGPWRSFEAVEFATLEWVDWFNNRRLMEPIGNIPPAEAEERYYAMLEEHKLAA